MTGKMTGQKSVIHLVVPLPQLFHEKETENEKGKVKKRRPPGEPRKIGNLFVVLKMRLMKMVGPQYDVKSQDEDGGFKLVSYIGLTTFKDYYTCASTSLNWIL
jgi:hypothetical protein